MPAFLFMSNLLDNQGPTSCLFHPILLILLTRPLFFFIIFLFSNSSHSSHSSHFYSSSYRALEHKWLKVLDKGAEGQAIVVMVVGAGRGPLVAATIR
jgi:PRMT5 arginine-N-methyltransferase